MTTSLKTIMRVALATLAVVALAVLVQSSTAADFGLGRLTSFRPLDQTGCQLCCPACDHVCKLNVDEVEVEKKCFEVETKVICIPRVVFPWQKKSCGPCDSCDGNGCSTCVHNCAKTRKVKLLKSKKYTCPACEYTWSAEPNPCAVPCADACCDQPCCDGCDGAPVVVAEDPVVAVEEEMPAPVPTRLPPPANK